MHKILSRSLLLIASWLLASGAQAALVFQNLGTSAPPASLGGLSVQAFDTAAQAAVANLTVVTSIPGSPVGGSIPLANATVDKRTVPGGGWATWSHSYTGPVFAGIVGAAATSNTLTLPAGTTAFYLYVEPNNGTQNITVTANSGAISSGPISVAGTAGATGFGFYATAAGDSISDITITVPGGASGFAMGEFGISTSPVSPTSIPTLSEWGLLILSFLVALFGFGLVTKRGKGMPV